MLAAMFLAAGHNAVISRMFTPPSLCWPTVVGLAAKYRSAVRSLTTLKTIPDAREIGVVVASSSHLEARSLPVRLVMELLQAIAQ
jgi:hypothetical protein